MLNIEIIKFEAQDVITASGVASVPATPLQPAKCNHGGSKTKVENATNWALFCDVCGTEVDSGYVTYGE